jgi:thiosulfate/3-mercaptopyruvate sulfurtransferase
MTPLITANQLEEIINSGENVLLCDCRFDLADTSAGRKAYEESHIPGAIYVDLDLDLSGEKTGDILYRLQMNGPKQKHAWVWITIPW